MADADEVRGQANQVAKRRTANRLFRKLSLDYQEIARDLPIVKRFGATSPFGRILIVVRIISLFGALLFTICASLYDLLFIQLSTERAHFMAKLYFAPIVTSIIVAVLYVDFLARSKSIVRKSALSSARRLARKGFAATIGFYFGSAISLCVGVAAILHAWAYVTFYSSTVYGYYNPFQAQASYGEIFLFLLDETLKGALFDVMEVFKIDLQEVLSVDAKKYFAFGSLLAAWRTFVSAYVIATGMYAFGRAKRSLLKTWRVRRDRVN
jgi:hypothetical protein